MTLRQLLNGLTGQPVPPLPLTGLSCHSKQVQPGEVFVAVRGPHHDGHEFLEEAVQRGAIAVVVERMPSSPPRCPVITVQDTRRCLPILATRCYGEPSKHLRLIGVTGTNGKTTTTYLLKAILEEATGQGVGLLGTVTYQIGERTLPSVNTTPGAVELQRLLSKMVEQRLRWCVMEVSSHALDQDRIDGLQFDAAVFTNLGSDHLDYHKTLERYAQAKRKIFSYLRPTGRAIINVDDPYGTTLIPWLRDQWGGEERLVRYRPEASENVGEPERLPPRMVRVRNIQCTWQGTSLVVDSPCGTFPLSSTLVGRHNVANMVAAAATSLSVGMPVNAIQRAMAEFLQVPGRMERIENDAGIVAVIDYAHTADALELVLRSLRELVRGGRLIVVFGCGGDRDQTKRPVMGRIASLWADEVVLTSDNPRSEDPLDIIHQIKAGCREIHVEVDREQAIHLALSMAKPDDAVLIAGKGHEAHQIFNHITVPFSDRDVVERSCAKLNMITQISN